jgi:hypothetical protein
VQAEGKRRNQITSLARPDGGMTEDPQELSTITNNFFGNLYESEGVHGMEEVLNTVPRRVTPLMNEEITAPYCEEEVKTALFQMYPTKAPGPDGYPAHFSNAIGNYAAVR